MMKINPLLVRRGLLFQLLILILTISCSDKFDEVENLTPSQLSLEFNEITEGTELKIQSLLIKNFNISKLYNEWEPSGAIFLDLRFNFQGITDAGQDVSGYISMVTVEPDASKVSIMDNSWEYVDPLDMEEFLRGDMVILINDSAFNDRNDSLAFKNVEVTDESFYINRAFSGKAWKPYMDGIKGYHIREASFEIQYSD